MKTLIIVGVILVIIIGYVIMTNNKLVNLRNKVKNQWSQIDVQLKRRFDLIPNLVETVKGYAAHEEGTLEKIVNARNSYLNAKSPEEQMQADGELTKAMTHLFALSESYPDLKANENFLSLQKELSSTEEKISYARQFFNDAVMKYNNKVQMFPSSLVAAIFRFKPESFFEATSSERENVKVDFKGNE